MRVAFFEDAVAGQLAPLTLLRPVFELACGQFSVRERVLRTLSVTDWAGFLRSHLAETYQEQFPEAAVNRYDWLEQGPTLLIHGRWCGDIDTLRSLRPDQVGYVGDQVVCLTLDPSEALLISGLDWQDSLARIARLRTDHRPVAGRLIEYPWDLITHNPQQLGWDFELRRGQGSAGLDRPDVALRGDRSQVWIDPTADLDPFVVLDARPGPITIDPGCVIQAFTRLEGPCHIGRDSRLFRAQVRGGTSIGPNCRVGGEVEASILHSDVNKYHDGFLGHSYVCPWVNLGAQSANSDLKTDYSSVQFPGRSMTPSRDRIDTGLMKVGCFIGDHTKTGLGSLFNTGSSIGVMSMILPSGELLPRHIPSFTTIWHGELSMQIGLERCFVAARAAMERRNREFTAAQQRLLTWLFHETTPEREQALTRTTMHRHETASRVPRS